MNNEFSWSAAREARLDRAIDRAVREIVQIDPPPAFRRRVLARLNDSTRHHAYLWPRFAVAGMAVVVLLISITVMRERVEPPPPPRAPTLATRAPGPIQLKNDIPPAPSQPQLTRERIRMPRVANVFGARSPEVSAATAETARRIIVVPPLAIVPLSARPIVIAPLVLPAPRKGGQ